MANDTDAPKQKPLSLILQLKKQPKPDPWKPDDIPPAMLNLGSAINSAGSIPGNGILHFAWTIPLDLANGKFLLSTVYDGDFEDYLDVFIDSGHATFDALFPMLEGAPPTPVQDHREEFYAFVRNNDVTKAGTAVSLFSAYPKLTVLDIVK